MADICLVVGAVTVTREWGQRRVRTIMGTFVAEAQQKVAEWHLQQYPTELTGTPGGSDFCPAAVVMEKGRGG